MQHSQKHRDRFRHVRITVFAFSYSKSLIHAGEVSVRGCGKFEMYASDMPAGCLVDSQPVDFQYKEHNGRLTVLLSQSESLQHTIEVVF